MATSTGHEGFGTVTPVLAVVEAERLVSFVLNVFGGIVTERTGGGWVVRIGDSAIVVRGGEAVRGREKLGALHVYVDDVDSVYGRAVAARADALFEPRDKPYGTREAGVKDGSGNLWYIAQGARHDAMRTVNPYVLAENALGLMEFLTKAFGAEEIGIFKTPEGALVHAALKIGDSALEFGEAVGMPFAFLLRVDEPEVVCGRAVAAGAEVVPTLGVSSDADTVCVLEDAWGITWRLSSRE